MKKWLKFASIVMVALLGIVAVAGFALAQGPEDGNGPPVGPQDEDGDGVCDVCGMETGDGLGRGWRFSQEGDAPQFGRGRSEEREFIDEDGDGVCDGFVDQEGEGVCDACGAEGTGDGFARGWRFSREGDTPRFGRGRINEHEFVDKDGDGICDGFVDQDGDGACDECGVTPQGGQGPRRGGRMGHHLGGRYNTP